MEMSKHERQLWKRIARCQRRRTREAIRNELAEQYMWLVHDVAHRFSRRLPAHVSRGDVLSEASLGLLEAIVRFRLDGGASPATFLRWRVVGRVLDWLRSQDHVTRTQRIRLTRLARAEELSGRSLSTEECQEQLGFARPTAAIATVSMHQGGGEPYGVPDSVDKPGSGTLSDCAYLLDGLPPRQRLILLLYYVEGLPMRVVGQQLGISESRISQIMPALLDRVRKNAVRFHGGALQSAEQMRSQAA